jgi:hypothetical protein
MSRAGAMMRVVPIVVMLIASTAAASPDERDKLNVCQALVDRTVQANPADTPRAAVANDADLARCRQIIREWTLRDSRMSVDEHGRPLR